MKKIFIIIAFLFSLGLHAQTESKWNLKSNNELTLDFQTFGQSYAQGLWQGSLGYATGMWLSNGRKGWGIVGSIVAVNVPIMFDKDYNNPEVLIGKNLGVLTVGVTFSFVITSKRSGKYNYQLTPILRKY